MAQKQGESDDFLCKFVEVLLHQIIFVRNVYPKDSFIPRELYQVQVHVSAHPQVQEYISACVQRARVYIRSRTLKQVVVQLKHPTSEASLENFVLDFRYIGDNKATRTRFEAPEKSCREVLTNVLNCDAALDTIPLGCTFSVHLYVKGDREVIAKQTDGDLWVDVTDEHHSDTTAFQMLPFKSLEMPSIRMQCYVEERKRKK